MTISSVTKKRFLILAVVCVFLTTAIYCCNLVKQKMWSQMGTIAFAMAKEKWAEGEKREAMQLWLDGIKRTISDTINREKAYKIMRQSDEFVEQGKLTEALNSCYEAAKYYNDEGVTSYSCMMIEQKIYGTPTPFSTPSPQPVTP
jgi:hypothetical protein